MECRPSPGEGEEPLNALPTEEQDAKTAGVMPMREGTSPSNVYTVPPTPPLSFFLSSFLPTFTPAKVQPRDKCHKETRRERRLKLSTAVLKKGEGVVPAACQWEGGEA